ncbi:IPExxxVDY family protein [Flavobacterium agrisoli]|uniref:IPExxxVDY family protein n=1 Tax=Flavobacterium agrisoli TaxID=2793066 RepID=A0A934PJW5_9FLAO|nr:IPExxxVDY family protein [Flavobacterium agrisoli]MBK0369491.1 IPExxxVDY family protein [Flavobacterium agrisoli]
MAVHKLDLGEFDEIDYNLIAIHTSLEDYRLAYFINQKLPINLSKSKNEIEISFQEENSQFSRFYFYDEENTMDWNLIQNKIEIKVLKNPEQHDLFSETITEVVTKVYLLPEFKKVDYFLKVEKSEEAFDILKILQLLNTIDSISTVYEVDTSKIKSKNNLIF